MSKKKIVIDEHKCIGCGICANTCKMSAIEMIDGKAKVTNAEVCDAIGRCLPVCPVNAISFEDNDTEEITVAVTKVKEEKMACGCPGNNVKTLNQEISQEERHVANASMLRQWPVQIKLVPENAAYFNNANLLIAADCSAYSYGNFHSEFMKNKITLIGCPKLDEGDYTDKLTAIISKNDVRSVTVVRMEVPCCGGIENAVKNALVASAKMIPWRVITISTDGKILEDM